MGIDPLPPDARTRAADLFADHGDTVCRRLSFRLTTHDLEMVSDAVIDAILQLSRHPERYDHQKAGLARFLTGAARRLLLKKQRAEHRRRKREQKKSLDPVTTVASAGRSVLDDLADHDLVRR